MPANKFKPMIKSIIATFFFTFLFSGMLAQDKLLTKGMKITRSMKIKKSSYMLDGAADLAKAVIIIEGKNIIIDFNNAILYDYVSPDYLF